MSVHRKVKTPVDLKERVCEPSGTYSPRPGTGASHQASPRATTQEHLCPEQVGVHWCLHRILIMSKIKTHHQICVSMKILIGIKHFF